MSWSTSRKLLYLLGVLATALIFISYFTYPLFKENPTCTDGKQNGNEAGVDCGGSCLNLCVSQVRPLSILWTRFFEVTAGVYDVLGYVENQNAGAGVPNILYRIKLYDDKNVLVAERDGKTYIGPNQISAIFESQIKTGARIPKRVFLEFEDGYSWMTIDPRFSKINLSVRDKYMDSASTSPRLRAVVENGSLTDVTQVAVAAILRDAEDNAIAVSETLIDRLNKQGNSQVFFTWLKPFGSEVSRIEIIPRINPFTLSY